jgi:hypothetical protein
MIKNISVTIVTRESQAKQSRKARSPQKSPNRQLNLFNPPQQRSDDYPLKLELLPDKLQWWDEKRYWLIHEASNLRVPGSFSESEAQKIQEISKSWDWNVDTRDRKVACGLNLLALAEIVCSPQICDRHRSTTSKKEKRVIPRIDEALKLAKGGEA